MKHVMLSGGRSPICLVLARLWKKNGWKVSIIEHKSVTFSRFSNSVSHYHLLPDPVHHFEQFSALLLELLERERPDILIPVNEDILHYGRLQQQIRALSIQFDVVAQPLLEQLHGKFSNIQLAQQAGIPAPHTEYLCDDNVDWQKYIVKPVYSRFGNQVIFDRQGLNQRHQGQYVKQQRINGVQICTYGFARQGKLLAYACYLTNFGLENAASLVFTPYRSQKVFEYMQRFIESHQLSGSISLDFMYDGQEYYFIECNPRLTHGAVLLGEQLPQVFMPEYIPEKILMMEQQRYGLKTIWLAKIIGKKKWRKTGKIYRHSQDMIANWRDPWPFLLMPFILGWLTLCALIKRQPLIDYLTEDIIYDADSYQSSARKKVR
ncbi:ATP-grasp domain-containing protein [Pragia fontium]|uniref:ATP-grasp domain-containing protein n=1 Tax=Pragia fontium TaxID=82985 RepID=UPI0011874307|nr:ATP-grasp domain-containing protein [Pragia fontium]